MYMNTKLQKIFDEYNLSLKDRRDFLQIYSLLSPQKKNAFIENFPTAMAEIESLRQELALEQEILFWDTLDSIERRIKQRRESSIHTTTKEQISTLKDVL